MIREKRVGEMSVIHLRAVDSPVFCEAYLVLRAKSRTAPLTDLVAEARRVIRDYGEPSALRVARPRRAAAVFFIGLLAGIALASTAFAVFTLFIA